MGRKREMISGGLKEKGDLGEKGGKDLNRGKDLGEEQGEYLRGGKAFRGERGETISTKERDKIQDSS